MQQAQPLNGRKTPFGGRTTCTWQELVERLHARRPGLRRDYAAGGHLSGVWGVWGAVWAALGRAGRIAEGLIRTASGSPAPGNGPGASEKAEPRRSPQSRRPGALREGQRGSRGAWLVLGSAGNVAEASESGLLLATQIGAAERDHIRRKDHFEGTPPYQWIRIPMGPALLVTVRPSG